MALFEIIIEMPVGSDVEALTVAARQAGFARCENISNRYRILIQRFDLASQIIFRDR